MRFCRKRASDRDITDEIGRLSVEAFERYGKGRGHPAQLNLADCLSYACAKAYQVRSSSRVGISEETDLQAVPY